MISNFKSIKSWILLLYIVLIPIIVIPITFKIPILEYWFIDYFILPKVTLLIVLTIIFLLVINRYKNNSQRISFSKRDEVLLMIYFLILAISTILSVDPYVSLLGQAFYHEGLLVIGCYFLIYLFAKEYYRFSNSHLYLIIISILVVLIVGLLQFLGIDIFKGEYSGSVYSTFRNPNYYGSYLVLLFPILMYLFLVQGKIIFLVINCFTLWGLLSTYTRGAWLGFLWSFFALICYTFILKFSKKRLITLLIAFFIVFLAFNSITEGKIINRFGSIAHDVGNTITRQDGFERGGANRIFIWIGTIELIKEKPILGYGIESFSRVFNEKYSELSEEKFGREYHYFKAHNEYLNIAQSSGVPSLVIYLLFIAYVILKSYRRVYINNHYLPILLGVQGYLVQAFFNVSIVGVAQIFWFFLGLLMNEKLFEKEA